MRTDRALTARRAISAALLAMLMLALAPSVATAADCAKTSVGLTPLTDLGTDSYMGVRGGLYPGGTKRAVAGLRGRWRWRRPCGRGSRRPRASRLRRKDRLALVIQGFFDDSRFTPWYRGERPASVAAATAPGTVDC
ncbi:MAG: hypothetical protein M3O91_01435 [Chloroflexota bacterium]|nr:hypothetical protein [Chloroflexota bacterium]